MCILWGIFSCFWFDEKQQSLWILRQYMQLCELMAYFQSKGGTMELLGKSWIDEDYYFKKRIPWGIFECILKWVEKLWTIKLRMSHFFWYLEQDLNLKRAEIKPSLVFPHKSGNLLQWIYGESEPGTVETLFFHLFRLRSLPDFVQRLLYSHTDEREKDTDMTFILKI